MKILQEIEKENNEYDMIIKLSNEEINKIKKDLGIDESQILTAELIQLWLDKNDI